MKGPTPEEVEVAPSAQRTPPVATLADEDRKRLDDFKKDLEEWRRQGENSK